MTKAGDQHVFILTQRDHFFDSHMKQYDHTWSHDSFSSASPFAETFLLVLQEFFQICCSLANLLKKDLNTHMRYGEYRSDQGEGLRAPIRSSARDMEESPAHRPSGILAGPTTTKDLLGSGVLYDHPDDLWIPFEFSKTDFDAPAPKKKTKVMPSTGCIHSLGAWYFTCLLSTQLTILLACNLKRLLADCYASSFGPDVQKIQELPSWCPQRFHQLEDSLHNSCHH